MRLRKARQPLMSPFGEGAVLPRFLTDRVPDPERHAVFDTMVSAPKRLTWYRDWAARCLGIDPRDEGMNELYRESLKRLEAVGILVRYDLQRSGTAWGLARTALSVTKKVAQIACPICRRRAVVGQDESARWIGQRCTQ